MQREVVTARFAGRPSSFGKWEPRYSRSNASMSSGSVHKPTSRSMAPPSRSVSQRAVRSLTTLGDRREPRPQRLVGLWFARPRAVDPGPGRAAPPLGQLA